MRDEDITVGRSDLPGEEPPEELGPLLRTAVGWTHRRVRTASGYDGLAYEALSVLHRLRRAGPQSLGGLARWEGVTPATMSQTVNRLLDGGFVTRETDAQDRRRARIALTENGVTAAQRWVDEGVAWIDAALVETSDADRETLRRAALLLIGFARS